MTDKENIAEIIPRKLSFISTTSDCRSRSTSNADHHTANFHESFVPLINNTIVEHNEDLPLFSNRQIYKNLAILSIAFLVLFTAYTSILVLQSSLNTKGNVGINSLIVLNAFGIV